jgi:hypothetical protein
MTKSFRDMDKSPLVVGGICFTVFGIYEILNSMNWYGDSNNIYVYFGLAMFALIILVTMNALDSYNNETGDKTSIGDATNYMMLGLLLIISLGFLFSMFYSKALSNVTIKF